MKTCTKRYRQRSLTAASALIAAIACLLPSPLAAHPPEDGQQHHDHGERQDAVTPRFPDALVLPAIDGPKPWSDKPLLNDPDRFQIAIMTDRTGGHRPGVWMKAVRQLNLLRPQFVMSVGDLIEGYTTDLAKLELEWKEFLGFIDQMQMKFFFVAGNHDLTNPLMHEIWRTHFGREWYSFDYKGVHFLCLSSEDPSGHIGQEQLAWIEQDLARHEDARWTLVFLHKPLWSYAERELAAGNSDPTNWKQVEGMLGRRPHTVFAGHVHYYAQYDRNGMKYYHLATTGGATRLQGVPYGQFDHVTWLTMESDGPHLANLLLDGILPPDAVTEDGIARFRRFLSEPAIQIAPILLEDVAGLSGGRIDIRFTNGFDTKVQLSGKIEGLPLRGLTVDPVLLELEAEPGQTAELAVTFQFTSPVVVPLLLQTALTAKLRSVEGRPLVAERSIPVIIDRKYHCPPPAAPVTVDGKLDEWPQLTESTSPTPLLLGNVQNWQGSADASLTFQLTQDEKFIYFAGRVMDDVVLDGADRLVLRLDSRPIHTRRIESRLRGGTFAFEFGAPYDGGRIQLKVSGYRNAKIWPGTEAAGRRTPIGYDIEAAIPIDFVTKTQGAAWHSVQLTPIVHDADQTGEKPCRIVWRGTEEVERRNVNFGHFVRDGN